MSFLGHGLYLPESDSHPSRVNPVHHRPVAKKEKQKNTKKIMPAAALNNLILTVEPGPAPDSIAHSAHVPALESPALALED